MKKTIVKNSRSRTGPDLNNREPLYTLRTVKDQEAFYFFEAVDKPTGDVARNLSDFLKGVKVVSLESLSFHLQRKDFENWITNTLGDSKLAQELAEIRPEDNPNLRTDVCKTVEDRIDQLKPTPDLSNGDNFAIVSLHK